MKIKVLIAIQARSTSSRFPGKALERLAGRSVLEHVILSCEASKAHMEDGFSRRAVSSSFLDVAICLVIPTGDEIKNHFDGRVDIVEGSETDVLDRYRIAFEKYKPDFLIRITGDCPLIPPFVISSHLKHAIKREADYVQNVDLRTRTSPDGWDVEVLSGRCFQYLLGRATSAAHREHVTLVLREESKPSWLRVWHSIGFIDESQCKISFDTGADKIEIERQLKIIKQKIDNAQQLGDGVFRL
jgi:spore coat polysaccharide biosynthesis protein SpsF